MTEHIKDSLQPIIAGIGSVLCLLISIWWGIRIGDGIRYLTCINLRLFLIFIMAIGLLFQVCTGHKKSTHFNALYRVMVWISGILLSLLIYSLGILFVLDILTLILRDILAIDCLHGASAFYLLLFGMPAGGDMTSYAHIWGSGIFNYDASAITALIGAAGITIYGLLHAQHLKIRRYSISLSEKDITSAAGISAQTTSQQHASKALSQTQSRKLCRIVHLSDLHMGSVVTAAYIRRVLQKVRTLKPDYVFLTGDTFNHGFVEECAYADRIAADFRDLNEVLSNGNRSHRIYAVCGNHDPLPDNPAFQHFLQKANIVLLNDETVSLPLFELAGRSGNHKDNRKPLSDWIHIVNASQVKAQSSTEGQPAGLKAQPPTEGQAPQDDDAPAQTTSANTVSRPLIVLDHYPDGMEEAVQAEASLFLCGHTHGGQYFPCNLLIRKQYSKKNGLLRGISQHGRTTCIVSLGTGFFQIPIRIGTDSEIIAVDLYT